MKKRTLLAVIALAVISLGMATFFYVKSTALGSKLQEEQKTNTALERALNEREAVLRIDTMLVNGDYENALQAYTKELEKEPKGYDKDLKMRIALTQKMRALGGGPVLPKKELDSVLLDSLRMRFSNTQLPVKQLDSMAFALQKAKVQITRLKQQLQNSAAGEYLTFKSKKGSALHYVGQVKNGKANGYGIALLETGSRYEGQWQQNLRHGQGTFYWPDGEYYIGNYNQDKREGEGTYFWPNGEKYVGHWQDDKRNGTGIFYGESGEIITSGTWKNDKLVKPEKKKGK